MTTNVISPEELIRLWSQHGTALEILARVRCRWPEDCVQTAFIRLSAQPQVPDDPVAWLARVVRNCAIDQSRTEGRRQQREQEFASACAEAFELQKPLDSDFDAQELAAALLILEVTDREIVTARVWGNMSFRQIADTFDLSSSAAHRRYQQAIQQLKSHLQERPTHSGGQHESRRI